MTRKHEKHNDKILNELSKDNPDLLTELIIASGRGDKSLINKIFNSHPELLEKFMALITGEVVNPNPIIKKSNLEAQTEREILALTSNLAHLLHDEKLDINDPQYLEAWIVTSCFIFQEATLGLDLNAKEKAKEIFRNAFIELAGTIYEEDASDFLFSLFDLRWSNILNELKTHKSPHPFPFITFYLYMAGLDASEYTPNQIMSHIGSIQELGMDPKELLRKCIYKIVALLNALDNSKLTLNKFRCLL